MTDFLTLSATELARRIREGEVSSAEVVAAHISHARRVNHKLNAIIEDRYEKAIADAKAADKRLANDGPEGLPPLHGVPCTIKEAFALAGFKQTGGLYARRHHVAAEDAVTVARLRKAGAIPIGTTNVPELCMWMETHNRIYGRTNNSYDPGRIAGGSSGGEGSIVGSGASPFGLGADVGGSIRMPAFFNGVFGHKASSGTVPNTGQFPCAHGEALRYLSTGPLVRRAEDLWPLLEILAGPDGEDPVCVERDLGNPAAVRMNGLRVLNVRGNGFVAVSPDLLDAQERAAAHLASAGAKVENVEIESLKRSIDIWSSMLSSSGGESFGDMMANGKFYSALLSLAAWSVRRSEHTLPAIVLSIIEPLAKLTPGRTRGFLEQGRALREELTEIIGRDGVMLYPSYSRPAPRHLEPLRTPFDWAYTAILNVMELPVTQVPLGLNPKGLPLGVQVAGIHGSDHVTVAVGMELERAFGGWVPPPRWFGAEDRAHAVSA